MEMDSKEHIAFCREQLFWQSYVNIDDGVLLLNVKRWTGGQLKMDREEDREEKFQSEGFDLTGHGEMLHCAVDFDIQFRYSGTTKLEDPKVWDGSSEFRPWMVQMCVNNEDPSSLLSTLEMEGMTLRELQVKGIWKLNAQLTIRSKYAKRLLLMKSTAKGIKTGSAGEILGSEAVEKEKDDNQFSGLDTSFDPGTALGLKPSTARDLSSGPAELKPFTGCLVSPDLEKKTLSCGPGGNSGVGRKFKKMKYEKCQFENIGKLLGWILASKREIWKLFICICFSIIVSQAEGCKSGAHVVQGITILHPSATCSTQLENTISCNGSLLSVCLYSVADATLAWGCAPDICLNGNVCPEWNILPNGSYVVQGKRNCSGCPPFYHLSQLLNKEFEECYNSSQKYYPRSTVAPTTASTGALTTESTGAPTTKNMQALSTGEIVGIAFGLLAVIGASSVIGICIWKKRQVYRNPPTQNGEEMGMTEQLQNGLNGSTANGEHTRIGAD